MTFSPSKIDELYAKATPGEWMHFFENGVREIQAKLKVVVIRWMGFDGLDIPKSQQAANAKLIIEMHNAWPEIKARLELLDETGSFISTLRITSGDGILLRTLKDRYAALTKEAENENQD